MATGRKTKTSDAPLLRLRLGRLLHADIFEAARLWRVSDNEATKRLLAMGIAGIPPAAHDWLEKVKREKAAALKAKEEADKAWAEDNWFRMLNDEDCWDSEDNNWGRGYDPAAVTHARRAIAEGRVPESPTKWGEIPIGTDLRCG